MVSELLSDVNRAVPDATGVVPRWVGRSVLVLPIRHSATPADARVVSCLNTAGDVVSVLLLGSTAVVVTLDPE